MNLIIDAKSINPYNNCNLRRIIYQQYLPMLIGIFDQMGARFDRLRCEVFKNLILSPMNTGLLRPAVATAPTVHGIETFLDKQIRRWSLLRYNSAYRSRYWNKSEPPVRPLNTEALQQHLPLTVCAEGCEAAEEESNDEARPSLTWTKRRQNKGDKAIAITVCGIETLL